MVHGKRPKDDVVREREQFCIEMLKLCWPKWRVKDTLEAEYGVSRATAEEDFQLARIKLAEEDNTPRSHKRSKVSAFLESVIGGDIKSEVRDRVRAAKEYIHLHALQEQQVEERESVSDIEVTIVDWRTQYQKRLDDGEVMSAKGNGSGNGA